jgi:hypothetical protein
VEAIRFPYGPFKFKILLSAEADYTVEASRNRDSWIPIFSGQAKIGEQPEFVDSEAANFGYRFYRVETEGAISDNVVGYVTTTLPPGFSLVANPLRSADATVAALFSAMPEGTTVSRFDGRQHSLVESAFQTGRWTNASQSLKPGDGAIVYNPSNDYKSLSFVGDVQLEAGSTPVPAGFTLRGATAPQPGRLDSDLSFPIGEGDVIHLFDRDKQKYMLYPFENGKWTAGPPVLGIAEGFWVAKKEGRNWLTNARVESRAAVVQA